MVQCPQGPAEGPCRAPAPLPRPTRGACAACVRVVGDHGDGGFSRCVLFLRSHPCAERGFSSWMACAPRRGEVGVGAHGVAATVLAHLRRQVPLRPPSLPRTHHDPRQDVVVDRLVDRLRDCSRTFPRALILGGAGAQVAGQLATSAAGGVEEVVYVDTSRAMLARAEAAQAARGSSLRASYVAWDPASEVLPVQPDSFDGEGLDGTEGCRTGTVRGGGVRDVCSFGHGHWRPCDPPQSPTITPPTTMLQS